MRETVITWWAECMVCGYDSKEAGFLDADPLEKSICPICAEDCGHSNTLSYRPATDDEVKAAKKWKPRKARDS